MLMKNSEIYNTAIKIAEAFRDENMYLPMRLNFYLQKNKKVLMDLSKDIEESRLKIIEEYGILNEDGMTFNIPEDKVAEASKELADLFDLEQEVNIYTISADIIPNDIKLTTSQMEAMLFMIEE